MAVWRALLKFKYSVQKGGWTEGMPRDWSVQRGHDGRGRLWQILSTSSSRLSRDIYSGHLGPNAIYFHPAAKEKGAPFSLSPRDRSASCKLLAKSNKSDPMLDFGGENSISFRSELYSWRMKLLTPARVKLDEDLLFEPKGWSNVVPITRIYLHYGKENKQRQYYDNIHVQYTFKCTYSGIFIWITE